MAVIIFFCPVQLDYLSSPHNLFILIQLLLRAHEAGVGFFNFYFINCYSKELQNMNSVFETITVLFMNFSRGKMGYMQKYFNIKISIE